MLHQLQCKYSLTLLEDAGRAELDDVLHDALAHAAAHSNTISVSLLSKALLAS